MNEMNPIVTGRELEASIQRYLRSALPVSRNYPRLAAAVDGLLSQPGLLVKGPFVEAVSDFHKGHSIEQLAAPLEELLHPDFSRLALPRVLAAVAPTSGSCSSSRRRSKRECRHRYWNRQRKDRMFPVPDIGLVITRAGWSTEAARCKSPDCISSQCPRKRSALQADRADVYRPVSLRWPESRPFHRADTRRQQAEYGRARCSCGGPRSPRALS